MTTPKELYESLSSNTSDLHREPTRVPQDLLDFMAKSGYSFDQQKGSFADWIHGLPKMIAKRYPKEAAELFTDKEFLYVGLLDLSEVNAKAMVAPNGGWLIVLNRGLPTFLYEVARAVSTRSVGEDPDGHRPFGESTPDWEETCRWIAEIFAWYRGVGRPAAFDFPIHPAQIMIAGELAIYSEQFVVSHEMAHFLAGHIENPFSRRKLLAYLPTDMPSSSWEQEFEADRAGLRTLWGKLGDPDTQSEQMDAYTGADFFLQVMSLFEELAEIPPSETHPPSKLRLERMRDYAKSLCADDSSWSNLFQRAQILEYLFAEVRKTILEPSPEQVQRAKQKADMAREKFEQLLDECTGGMVPNYVRFDHEVGKMLGEYPSDAVCSAIASSIDEVEEHLETLHKQKPPQLDRTAFQKWKLLNRLLNLVPLPEGVDEAIEAMRRRHGG